VDSHAAGVVAMPVFVGPDAGDVAGKLFGGAGAVDDVFAFARVEGPAVLAEVAQGSCAAGGDESRDPDGAGAARLADFLVAADPVSGAFRAAAADDFVADLQLLLGDFEDFVAVG